MESIEDFLRDTLFTLGLGDGDDDCFCKNASKYCSGECSCVYTATYALGAVFYILFGFATIAIVLYKKFRLKTKIHNMTLGFYIGLAAFMFCRAVWVIFEEEVTRNKQNPDSSGSVLYQNLDYFNKVWNRVCFCIFLLVFQLLLFYWIDTIHTTVNVAFAKDALSGTLDFGFITPLVRRIMSLFSALIVVLVIVLALIRIGLRVTVDEMTSSDSQRSSLSASTVAIENANNIIISLLFLAYGCFFLFYGTKLNYRVHKMSVDSKVQGVWTNEIISILLFICFLIRFFMFLWGACDLCYFEENHHLVYTYFVPELGSAFLVLLSVNSKLFRNTESNAVELAYENSFEDPLLKEEQDNEKFLRGAMD